MKKLIACFAICSPVLLGACGLLDMPDKMDKLSDETATMSNQMNTTNQGIHLQTLQGALNQMLSAQNIMVPDNPAAMIPGGQVFAETATSEDLVQLVKAFLMDIETTQPDPSANVNGTLPAGFTDQMEQVKKAKLTALSVIMGFADQSKIEDLVNNEVLAGGLYQRWVYPALMLREEFINGDLFQGDLMTNGIGDVGELQQAVTLTQQVEYIETLPSSITSQIKLQVTMLVPADNVNVTLNTTDASTMWTQIGQQLPALSKVVTSAESSQFTQLENLVNAKIKAYSTAPATTASH